jgi:hypothetical protein
MMNLGGFDKMLNIAGDRRMPAGVNDALKATGSSYQVPDEMTGPQGGGQLPEGTGKALSMLGGKPDLPKGLQKLEGSPVVGLAKKVASAVAAYYTGGLSSLAMNVGGQVVSQNNPRAGALVGAASKLYGG